MTTEPKYSARAFGVSVGIVLVAMAAVLAWRGRLARAEAIGAAGVVLVALGAVAPRVLRPLHIAWWRLSLILGRISTTVLLTAVFALVLTPLSLWWRLTGKDPLQRRRAAIGWLPHPVRYRRADHYTRMF